MTGEPFDDLFTHSSRAIPVEELHGVVELERVRHDAVNARVGGLGEQAGLVDQLLDALQDVAQLVLEVAAVPVVTLEVLLEMEEREDLLLHLPVRLVDGLDGRPRAAQVLRVVASVAAAVVHQPPQRLRSAALAQQAVTAANPPEIRPRAQKQNQNTSHERE